MWWCSQPVNRIFLAVGITDMRKAINGLSSIVEGSFGQNVFSGDLFAFCNRQKTIVKILYWDQTGFCLWMKRLEEGHFKWPQSDQELLKIGEKELEWLLAGLDIKQAIPALDYQFAC